MGRPMNTALQSFLLTIAMLSSIIRTTKSIHLLRHNIAFIPNMSNSTLIGKHAKANPTMELTSRPAVCSLVPPGVCQFTPQFTSVPLLDRIKCGEGGTSYILRFGLPNNEKSLGLTTCACLLACAQLMDREKGEFIEVVRPYTPISTNDQVGSFDLLIKNYGSNGYLSKYLCQDLEIGGEIQFKHIDFNVKFPAPFQHKKIGMIAGTGITPMIQALHAILGTGPDGQRSATEEVTLLYGSRTKSDILGGDMLSAWSHTHEQFKYYDVLSHEPNDSTYDGLRGWIDKAKIENYLPPASMGNDVIIFVCGPPILYELLCGPRNETEIRGVLGELGYSSEQVFKF